MKENKVYLVMGGFDYEGDFVLKVFWNKEDAEKYAKEVSGYDSVEVEEREVE